MGYPRSRLVDSTRPGYYHCISRCVQRAFLCGDRFRHRRRWIEDRLAELLALFSVEVCGYAIMANHLHLIVKIDPQATRHWSDREVARRLIRLFPRQLQKARAAARTAAEAERIEEKFLKAVAADRKRIADWRKRLGSISWFNKLLKEPIARRANRESGCTGHFWEGRFKSIRLLDDAALLTCMAYVDLNPRRAGMARTLGDSAFTSILERLKVLKGGRKRKRRARRSRVRVALIPIESLFSMTTAEYVSLVSQAAAGHDLKDGQRQMLAGLGLEPRCWSETLARTVQWFGTAVGTPAKLVAEARRRRARRVVNPLPIYAA